MYVRTGQRNTGAVVCHHQTGAIVDLDPLTLAETHGVSLLVAARRNGAPERILARLRGALLDVTTPERFPDLLAESRRRAKER